MKQSPAPQGLRENLLLEYDVAEKQILAMADAMPADRFSWRPGETARSVSEVFVHIAAGNFFLSQFVGRALPADIYGDLSIQGEDDWWTVARRNDELEKRVTAKEDIVPLLTRSLSAARETLAQADDDAFTDFNKRRFFLRMLVHLHEHMGQMIGYTRMNGLPAPWPDWRPDRR